MLKIVAEHDATTQMVILTHNIEFLFIELHVLTLGVLKTLHDFIVRDLAMFRTKLGVVNSLMVGLMKQVEMHFGILLDLGIHGLNFEGHQTEAKLASPAGPKL